MITDCEIAQAAVDRNKEAGYHYFDEDTLQFFGSKVHDGYEIDDDVTLVVMSNQDKHPSGVLDGRRHWYLIIVGKDGRVSKPSGDLRYDVSAGTGYWFTGREAIDAAWGYLSRIEATEE